MTTAAQQIREQLGEMDSLFGDFFKWLAGQYDPASGGFYYARSSFDMENFIPDIESTAQAVNILIRSGLFDALPQETKENIAAFFRNKQDPDSGYFYDADPNMRKDEVMVMRALGYSTNSLHRLGSAPLYPLPHQVQERPDYLRSPESYVEWLKRVDLSNSWRGCDFMGTPNHHIAKFEEPERREFIEAGERYFASIQDPETGLWGEGNRYIRISGTFKLNAFYSRFGVRTPNIDRIYRTILSCLREDEARDMCWIRNPIDLLGTFRQELRIPEEELEEIIRITVSNMRKLLRPDGGFSREIHQSPPAPNVAQVKEGEFYSYMPAPVPIGQGLVEGDMNAGTQALLIREYCHKLAGVEHRPLASASPAAFLDNIGRR
ncbi:hypothetical protein SK3146_06859 [Paenibacillus konkukensis]|uniref:Uncharacterized protein n=1 Tax=Paenibacillus konkukensis TaxID=2020716 RepID=A0ABY4RZL6_9BACL|nr:hypothetical protein [Paenibacillus konkukensis]UQZ87557.1 hypothetical protein SK3146_06859 [Paenibacillus konkukensis]